MTYRRSINCLRHGAHGLLCAIGMKIAVLSYCNPFCRYVIQQIQRHWDIEILIHPIWTPRSNPSTYWSKFCAAPIGSLVRGSARRIADRERQWFISRLQKELFASEEASRLSIEATRIGDYHINTPPTADLLRKLDLDLLIVSHGPILKPEIFNIPRLGTINIHLGYAPQYRGEDSIFWPLYYGDYEHVGVTIHRIDAGIDTGPILARGTPALTPQDTEVSAVAKTAHVAADLVHELLTLAAEGQLPAGRKETGGRLFLRRHRLLRHDVQYHLRRLLLKRRPPYLPEQREVFADRREAELVLS
jgi:methionyl-tRNA formyltransferase